jgi:hypothetical protein
MNRVHANALPSWPRDAWECPGSRKRSVFMRGRTGIGHPGVCGSVAGQEDAMAMDSKEITGEVHFPKMLRALSELGDFEHMQPARLAVERS